MARQTKKQQFLETLAPYARRFEQQTGIPAAWALAMAANETGWDASNPVLFGIKGDAPGPGGKSQQFKTWEDYGKGRVDTVDRFAVYDNPGQAFDHLAQEMGTARYRNAPKTSAYAFADYLKRQGWATDPAYAKKIAGLAAGLGGGDSGGSGSGGGQDVAEPDEYQSQTLVAVKAYIKTLETERKGLLEEWATLQERMQKADPALPLSGDLQAEQLRLRDALSQNATAMRSAHATQFQVEKVVANSLDNELKIRELRIREGQETRAQANDRWDRALETAKLGVSNALSGLGLLRQAMPAAGDRRLANAVAQSVKNWNKVGGNVSEDWDLPVYDFDPMRAVAPYQPPAPDWQEALTRSAAAQPAASAPPTSPPAAAPAPPPLSTTADDGRAVEAARQRQMDEDFFGSGAWGNGTPPAAAPAPAPAAGYSVPPGTAPDWPLEAPAPYAAQPWREKERRRWADAIGQPTPVATPTPGPRSAPGQRSAPAPPRSPTPAGPIRPPEQQPGESDEEWLRRLQRTIPRSFLQIDPSDPRYRAIVKGDGSLDDLMAMLADYAPRVG